DAIGRYVPSRVAEAEARGPCVDGRFEERAQYIRMRARRIFGHEAKRKLVATRLADGVRDGLHEKVRRPVLDVMPDGRASDEGIHLDRPAGPIRRAGDARDVRNDGSSGGRRHERQPSPVDLAAEEVTLLFIPTAGSRETDTDDIHPYARHRVEEVNLVP